MSKPAGIPILAARKLAEQYAKLLAPYFEKDRLLVAGSVRRKRIEVNDVDFVGLPKSAESMAELEKRIRAKCKVIKWGKMIASFYAKPTPQTEAEWPHPVQVDLYFARPAVGDLLQTVPSNWGSMLLTYTGSRSHNQRFCQAAKAKGLKFKPGRGLVDAEGKVLAAATEKDLYGALELPYLVPWQRDAWGDRPQRGAEPDASAVFDYGDGAEEPAEAVDGGEG